MDKDKLSFLKEIYSREEFLTLSLDAAKLYLILVIVAQWPKMEGNISFKTIKKALGNHFQLNRLEQALSALSGRGLIQRYHPVSKIPAEYRQHDLRFYYKIKDLPLATKSM